MILPCIENPSYDRALKVYEARLHMTIAKPFSPGYVVARKTVKHDKMGHSYPQHYGKLTMEWLYSGHSQ